MFKHTVCYWQHSLPAICRRILRCCSTGLNLWFSVNSKLFNWPQFYAIFAFFKQLELRWLTSDFQSIGAFIHLIQMISRFHDEFFVFVVDLPCLPGSLYNLFTTSFGLQLRRFPTDTVLDPSKEVWSQSKFPQRGLIRSDSREIVIGALLKVARLWSPSE